jgi:hypothetical protein
MIEIYKNLKYKVKTPSGYKTFAGIRRTTKSKVLELCFGDGTKLECSLDHVFVVNGKEILAKNIKIKQQLSPNKIVFKITQKANKKFLYDLIGVEDGSVYITDDIVSHNCDFSTSGNTVIMPDILQYYLQTYTQDPIEKRGFDNNIWVWERPSYSRDYIVTADVARGDGSDYSAFHIIDVESAVQVAEYKGQLTTKDFGNMLVSVATEYNDALLVIENANVGWATIQQVIDRGYKNLYYSYKENVFDSDAYLTKGFDVANKSDMVAGFTLSSKIRPLAISKLELYMREKGCIIRSRRLMDELLVFVWKNAKAEAAQGYNDDLVMSWTQGLWVRDTALKLRQAGIELTKMAVSSIKNTISMYSGTQRVLNNNPWKQNIDGIDHDITWLL